jgi:hypothetical protein
MTVIQGIEIALDIRLTNPANTHVHQTLLQRLERSPQEFQANAYKYKI